MAEAMKYLAMGIASSRRLGWIALGLYIVRMNMPASKRGAPMPVYKTMLDYYRAIKGTYKLQETMMSWADDLRMVYFPDELLERLDAIDESWNPFQVKELQKEMVIRRVRRARVELDNMI